MAFYAPDGKGRRRTAASIARDQNRARSVIETAARDAFARGLVRVKVIRSPLPPPRRRDLEPRLKDTFGVTALVLDRDAAGDLTFGELQERLGWLMGLWMAENAEWIFIRGALVANEAGRAVDGAVKSIRDSTGVALPGRGVGSLTGSIGQNPAQTFPQDPAAEVDADSLALDLWHCIAAPRQIFQVAHRLAVPESQAAEVLQRVWFMTDAWQPPPRTGLLGLGVLNVHHRFFAATKTDVPFLQPIAAEVKRLYQLLDAERLTTPDYCPVAGLCHALFFVEPPPNGPSLPASVERQMRDLIEAINARLVTVPLSRLNAIENVYLIAGGDGKTRALHELLTRPDGLLNLRAVATDSKTAERLLAWGRTR